MTLIKRWYQPLRWGDAPPTDLLVWRQSDDGRAYLVSRKTVAAYVARWLWSEWRYWVMHRAYYPLLRSAETMCLIEIPEAREHRLSDWKTLSLREMTLHRRAHRHWRQGYELGVQLAQMGADTSLVDE